jgi:XTP/dITP diphosphohydrolase
MQICFATHNQNKVQELRQLVGEKLEIISLRDLGVADEIEETGATLKENALLKARYVFDNYAVACFADDSGLEVDALNGAPGVFSGRFAGVPGNDEKNIDKLLELLVNQANKQARFRTVIALVKDDEQVFFEGVVEGIIIDQRRGRNGFGYDAVFLPNRFDRTFAEMGMEEKNLISHRALAVQKLTNFLKQNT